MYEQALYEQVIAGVGLALGLLLVLCLPFAGVKRLVLGVYAWGLRLALLALLGAAAYLWFRPEQVPVAVTDTLANFPWLLSLLPEPGTPNFAISAATLVVAVLLPLLAVLDASRKLAGWRLRGPHAPAAGPGSVEPLRPASASQPGPRPAPRRIDRRAAANTMAEAGSRNPSRAANGMEP